MKEEKLCILMSLTCGLLVIQKNEANPVVYYTVFDGKKIKYLSNERWYNCPKNVTELLQIFFKNTVENFKLVHNEIYFFSWWKHLFCTRSF